MSYAIQRGSYIHNLPNKAFSETVMSQERLRGSFEALVRAKSVSEVVKNPKITKAVKCKAGVTRNVTPFC